jgi:hypothetical protein
MVIGGSSLGPRVTVKFQPKVGVLGEDGNTDHLILDVKGRGRTFFCIPPLDPPIAVKKSIGDRDIINRLTILIEN